VVIEAALGELERGGDIVHGSGIVSLLLKKAGGSAENFLARFVSEFLAAFDSSFAKHNQRWYRGMNH
jgi:hypothetical protein